MVVSELYKDVDISFLKAALEGFFKADPTSYRHIRTLRLCVTPIWIPLVNQFEARLERAAKAVLGNKASSEQVSTYIKENYCPATGIHLDAGLYPCTMSMHKM